MSTNLSRAVQRFVTSVIVGKDVVPRVSVVNLGRLIDQMVSLHRQPHNHAALRPAPASAHAHAQPCSAQSASLVLDPSLQQIGMCRDPLHSDEGVPLWRAGDFPGAVQGQQERDDPAAAESAFPSRARTGTVLAERRGAPRGP